MSCGSIPPLGHLTNRLTSGIVLCQLMGDGIAFEIPRHVHHRHPFQAAEVQVALDDRRRLVVQQVVVPPPLHQFGHHHRQRPARVRLLQLSQELDQWGVEPAVRGGDNDQTGGRHPGRPAGVHHKPRPLVFELLQSVVVGGGDVQGVHVRG